MDKTVDTLRSTILLVDDDPDNLTVLGSLLRPHYDVLAAPSGERALEIATSATKPDLILLDVMMSGMDGYEVLARLRENPATRDIPVIFVTGLDAAEDEEKGLELGAADYLTKPYRPPIVLARVRGQLELKHASDRLNDHNVHLEAEVARRGEVLHSIATAAQDAIIMIDGEGRVAYWNPAATSIFGYTEAEAMGQALHPLLAPPRFRDAFAKGLAGFRAGGKGAAVGRILELTALHKNGSEFPIEISLAAIKRDDAWWSVGIARDITERKQHEAQIERLNRVLRTIIACNQSLVRARNETDLPQAICRDIVEVGGYLLAWVVTPDQARSVAHYGDETAFQRHAELESDPEHARHCQTRLALRERRPAVCNRQVESGECGFGQLRKAGVMAILALPLLAGEQLLGAVTIFSANPDAFDASEIGLMEELAADLAYGIAALRTSAERDHYQGQYGQAMKNIVAAIARTLEMRDPYTAGHQQRVTALAQAIARKMDLGEAIIKGLYYGGMIHDIGKIAVPAEILAKPTRLSKIEYQLIQAHSETGYEIVRDIDFPWPVADMIVQHHERLDGSGYPHGLKGDEICLEARIVAVADVVEAMSSHRPYRPGLGMDTALAEIERGSGLHFDPAVVAACVEVVRSNGMNLPE